MFLKPTFVRSKSKKTSKTVMKTARISGISKSKYSAIAAPITSAMSVAIIASSVSIHRMIPKVLLVRARIAWARSIWLTIPSFADMY